MGGGWSRRKLFQGLTRSSLPHNLARAACRVGGSWEDAEQGGAGRRGHCRIEIPVQWRQNLVDLFSSGRKILVNAKKCPQLLVNFANMSIYAFVCQYYQLFWAIR